jgi:AraC-like DNA-binding protein
MASFELVSFLHPDNPPGPPLPDQLIVNNDLHLIHTIRGAGTTRIGHRTFHMTPRSVIFIEPHVEYSVNLYKSEPLEMINFHFHLFVGSGVPFTRVLGLPPSFRPRKLPQIHRALRRWHRAWERKQPIDPLDRADIVARLHALTIGYLREFARPPAEPLDPSAERLAQLLRDPKRSEFDAQSCAEELFMSVSQMNRRFRQAFSTSPKDFWLRERYLLARSRLLYGTQPISAIALEMGFDGPNYFSRWFKKMSGVAPLAFRKRTMRREI